MSGKKLISFAAAQKKQQAENNKRLFSRMPAVLRIQEGAETQQLLENTDSYFEDPNKTNPWKVINLKEYQLRLQHYANAEQRESDRYHHLISYDDSSKVFTIELRRKSDISYPVMLLAISQNPQKNSLVLGKTLDNLLTFSLKVPDPRAPSCKEEEKSNNNLLPFAPRSK